MYYKLHHTVHKIDLHTGFNSTSLEDLTSAYILLKSIDAVDDTENKWYFSRTTLEIIEIIKADNLEIIESHTPFREPSDLYKG